MFEHGRGDNNLALFQHSTLPTSGNGLDSALDYSMRNKIEGRRLLRERKRKACCDGSNGEDEQQDPGRGWNRDQDDHLSSRGGSPRHQPVQHVYKSFAPSESRSREHSPSPRLSPPRVRPE